MPDRRRLALLLEYDGTPYVGSQFQANGPSIQAEVERAIAAMTGGFTRAAFAGRTDAGVHALGQVVAFDTETVYGCHEFVGGLNVRLPAAIAVRAAREVRPDFDPRRDAVARWYRYSILNAATRSPLRRRRVWQVAGSLNAGAMRQAAELLIGEQDLAAFAPPEAQRFGTKREVRRLSIRPSGRLVCIDITANAFLMHQVRRTVAALVDIGSGRLPLTEFERHLREARPGSFERTAPAEGLCLMAVRYPSPLFGNEQEQNEDDENF